MKKSIYKIFLHRFLLLAVVSSVLIFSSCDDDSEASKEDQVRELLTGSAWKMTTVSVDGTDKTDVYKDLTLTFGTTTYTSTNGGVVWPATGTWAFTAPDATAIERNDGLVVSIQEITSSSLKLGLTWNKTTLGSGRTSSVSGQHVFSFGK